MASSNTIVLMAVVVEGGWGVACEFYNVFNVQFQTAWGHKSSLA